METLHCTINEYYITDEKIIGRIGENNIGLTKGRFIAIKPYKTVETAAYDEIGVKYAFGTKGEKPLGELFKERVARLSFETHSSSAIGKAHAIAKELFGRHFQQPELVQSTPYKTCTVQVWSWLIGGRKVELKQTIYPSTQRYELDII